MDHIASKPVKCPDCAVWWRGMEHRCSTPIPKPNKRHWPDNENKEHGLNKYTPVTPTTGQLNGDLKNPTYYHRNIIV